MDKDTIFSLCQSILQNTHDGDTLAGRDLHLVESAANGFLSPGGEIVLYQLDHSIKEGDYELPAFCGVNGLTRGTNGDRSIFWNGKKVEHYDHDFWCEGNWQEDMKRDAEKLGKICQSMDDAGVEINFSNYLDFSQRIPT